MKTFTTTRHSRTAALCAGVVAAHLAWGMATTALAQSATPPGGDRNTTSQTRLDPDSERASATDPTAPDALDDDTPQDQSRITTGSIDSPIEDPSDIFDQETLQELRRQNQREATVDGLRMRTSDTRNDAQGIRLGTFILRPSITETIGSEQTTTGKDVDNRTFLRSGFKATLDSDWSLHRLRIDADGAWDKTLSGDEDDDPEASIRAELRLDLTDETTANLRAGYSLRREDIGDPNAIANATTQSDVNEYTAGADITRDLGILRATAGVDFRRETYGDAVLANGERLSQSDRDRNAVQLRGRLGYELSAALIPFVEAVYGRTIYDQHQDSLGYVRDADAYGAKAGMEVDFGEKLKGELAGGYLTADFDDSALKSISAFTLDGNALWSPYRGTDLALNLRTEIEPSTTAGASGSTAYIGTAVLSQVILQNLTGQISSGLTLRDYSDKATSNETVLALGTGVTWSISRSLDMNADIAWEKTDQDGAPMQETLRAGVGLTLKR